MRNAEQALDAVLVLLARVVHLALAAVHRIPPKLGAFGAVRGAGDTVLPADDVAAVASEQLGTVAHETIALLAGWSSWPVRAESQGAILHYLALGVGAALPFAPGVVAAVLAVVLAHADPRRVAVAHANVGPAFVVGDEAATGEDEHGSDD